ncbi:MAG: hypothetical protein AB1916_08440 [Thermodesulfobacteriota bacterium]
MTDAKRRLIGIAVFALLYPAFAPLVRLLPNPMVPGAGVALNMVFPVLAGYFYGPCSGAAAGALGAGLAALAQVDMFHALAVLPHALMGGLAGVLGRRGSELLASLALLLGHALNMLFFFRLGLLPLAAEALPVTALGLLTETSVEMVAVVLAATVLRRALYCRERW